MANTPEAERLRKAIIGPWQLGSWYVAAADGTKTFPYGEAAEGMIVYTENGHMCVQLLRMKDDAKVHTDKVHSDGATLEEIMTDYFAYFGTYSIDAEGKVLTHHLAAAVAPSWVGSDQVRHATLIGEDKLILEAQLSSDGALSNVGAGGRNVLEWLRMH